MVVELLRRCGLEGFQLILNSVGCTELPAGVIVAALKEKLRDVAPTAVRRLPAPRDHQSAARARLQGSRGPAHHRHAALDPRSSVRGLPHALRGRARSSAIAAASPIEVRPRLVRGLDYYMRTTFEITHGALGAQNSVLGGGRYDGLAESLGSKVPAPGIGFSIGEDRLVMSVEEAHPDAHRPLVDVFLAPLGEAAELSTRGALAAELRAGGYVGRAVGRSQAEAGSRSRQQDGRPLHADPGRQRDRAGTYLLKDMASGEQVTLTRDELAARIRKN